MHNETVTLREALTSAASQLAQREDLRPNAAKDAELLLFQTLAAPRTILFTDPDLSLTPEQQLAFDALIARRLAAEPIQYILGHQEFYGLTLRVTPAVLIPRPETELLVEAALARLPRDRQVRIADIGTGSGAIAIAIAHHLPLASVTALDLSPAALEIARENAATHHLEDRVRFLESDLLAAVATEASFDAALSNPPYVPISDRDSLHPEVRDHEPSTALFAGLNGLDIYRRLVPQAFALLKPDGLLALEIGHGQRDALARLLSNWDSIEFLNDLQQIPRVALATRPSEKISHRITASSPR
jgi:release factor glutamine methyltransferase